MKRGGLRALALPLLPMNEDELDTAAPPLPPCRPPLAQNTGTAAGTEDELKAVMKERLPDNGAVGRNRHPPLTVAVGREPPITPDGVVTFVG